MLTYEFKHKCTLKITNMHFVYVVATKNRTHFSKCDILAKYTKCGTT